LEDARGRRITETGTKEFICTLCKEENKPNEPAHDDYVVRSKNDGSETRIGVCFNHADLIDAGRLEYSVFGIIRGIK
jgi:hypothetical protein